MNLQRRIERLEAVTGASRWFDLATWQAERASGVTVDEQERRRCAVHPGRETEIRETFAKIRRRLAVIAEL